MNEPTERLAPEPARRLGHETDLRGGVRAALRSPQFQEREATPSALLPSVPPVVVDANILRNDVLYAIRHDQPTILINAVRRGWIRLFCAQHVLDEVRRHAARWTNEADLSAGSFIEAFNSTYLPLLRVVDVDRTSTMLTAREQARIDDLDHGPDHLCDPDDVPTAILALQLSAFVLTEDRKALWAIHGLDADLAVHHAWQSQLASAGVAGFLGESINLTTTLGLVLGGEALSLVNWIWRNAPGLIVLGGALVGVKAWRAEPATKAKLKSGLGIALLHIGDIADYYLSEQRDFEAASAAPPDFEEIAVNNSAKHVLGRACVVELARAPGIPMSASSLASRLPSLPAAQSAPYVRDALRTLACFTETVPGLWQVGQPAS